MDLRTETRAWFGELQDTICAGLERLDGTARFREDRWEHRSGGGGVTRIFGEGAVFEKGGVNLSAVRGTLSERIAARLDVAPQGFFATGVSLVVHPRSPLVPTAHMNVRYIALDGPAGAGGAGTGWFGGGADLTPHYLFREDAQQFHRVFAAACDGHDPACYARFKRGCDEYFRLPHRGEARGVGGIFFDYLKDDPQRTFAFVRRVGSAFLDAYGPIVERRRDASWSAAQRVWQEIRRGRYVEFNLIHDRGTLFGLETGGRTESILMSLPPVVRWEYAHEPVAGSPEAELLDVLRRPVDWLGRG